MKMHRYLWLTSLIVAASYPARSSAQLVAYDNLAPSDWAVSYPAVSSSPVEFGDEIILADNTPRVLNTFTLQYYADNARGDANAVIRFYQNDGTPDAQAAFEPPSTLFYSSGPVALPKVDGKGVLTLENLQVPVNNADFTWTVEFTGLESGGVAGAAVNNVPSVGGSYPDFWLKSGSEWQLQDAGVGGPSSFGAQITVVPEPAATASIFLISAILTTRGRGLYRKLRQVSSAGLRR